MQVSEKEQFLNSLTSIEESNLSASEKAVALLSLQLRVSIGEAGLPSLHREDYARVKKIHSRIVLNRPLDIFRQPETNRRVTMAFTAPEPKPGPEKLEPEKKKSFIDRVKKAFKI